MHKGTTEVAVTGLTGGTVYVFAAYRDTSCDTPVAAAAAFVIPVAVDNTGEAAGVGRFAVCGYPGNGYAERWATAFTTGDHPAGYTLQSVTADFEAGVGVPGDIGVRSTLTPESAAKTSPAAGWPR